MASSAQPAPRGERIAYSPGWFPMPAQLFTLAGKLRGEVELWIVLAIARATKPTRGPGDPRPLYSEPLTIADLATSSGAARSHVEKDLGDLQKRGIIAPLTEEEESSLGLAVPKGLPRKAKATRYRLLVEKWAKVPAPAKPPAEMSSARAASKGPELVQPGAKLRISYDEPVAHTEIENRTSRALSIGENGHRGSLVISESASTENKPVKAKVATMGSRQTSPIIRRDLPGDKSPSDSVSPTAAVGAAQPATPTQESSPVLSAAEVQAAARGLGFEVGQSYAGKIATALGPCPLPYWCATVRERVQRARAKKESLTCGILLPLAVQAREAYLRGDPPPASPVSKSGSDEVTSLMRRMRAEGKLR